MVKIVKYMITITIVDCDIYSTPDGIAVKASYMFSTTNQLLYRKSLDSVISSNNLKEIPDRIHT